MRFADDPRGGREEIVSGGSMTFSRIEIALEPVTAWRGHDPGNSEHDLDIDN
jgi:hypothetical protein